MAMLKAKDILLGRRNELRKAIVEQRMEWLRGWTAVEREKAAKRVAVFNQTYSALAVSRSFASASSSLPGVEMIVRPFDKALEIEPEWKPRLDALLLKNEVDLSKYPRIIRIVPNTGKTDLQNQALILDQLRVGWGETYERWGNVDINHMASPTRTEEKAKKKILDEGYEWTAKGKTFLEIGRPIPKTFDPLDCSFLVYIYHDRNDDDSLCNWFWKTLTEYDPPRVWKASVGMMSMPATPGMIQETIGDRTTTLAVGMIERAAWYGISMTELPVDSFVPPVDVIKNTAPAKKPPRRKKKADSTPPTTEVTGIRGVS